MSLTLGVGQPCTPTGSTHSSGRWVLQPHLCQPRAGRQRTGLPRRTRHNWGACCVLITERRLTRARGAQNAAPGPAAATLSQATRASSQGRGLWAGQSSAGLPPASRVSQGGGWLGRYLGSLSGLSACRTPGSTHLGWWAACRRAPARPSPFLDSFPNQQSSSRL